LFPFAITFYIYNIIFLQVVIASKAALLFSGMSTFLGQLCQRIPYGNVLAKRWKLFHTTRWAQVAQARLGVNGNTAKVTLQMKKATALA